MIEDPADDETVSLADAIVLLDEVNRLSRELRECEVRLAELDRLAHSDPLIGLPNRRRFEARLSSILTQSRGHRAAMLFVDVDGLKTINDRFGHNAGDRVIAEVGRLLARTVRNTDLVARLAGDEFGVLLEQSDELSAWQMALRIVETVDEAQLRVDGMCLRLSVAVGVAEIQRGDTLKSVFARADKEMYRIKNLRSRNPVRADGRSWPSVGTGHGRRASARAPQGRPFLASNSDEKPCSDSASALQNIQVVTSRQRTFAGLRNSQPSTSDD